MGKPLIMGRRTFQSLKKPLDGRDNIVITRDSHFEAPLGVSVTDTFADALTLARVLATTRGADEIMVIGGAEVYRAALPYTDRIYWTDVHAHPEGDTVFPSFNPAQWKEVSREQLGKGEKDEFSATLRVLERVSSAA
jgi:dihydrofolate reductase